MPKTIEEPKIQGDKFVLVGFADDIAGMNNDFYKISSSPIIQSFTDEQLWYVSSSNWNADTAKPVRYGDERFVSSLNTSEYVIIREGEYLNIVGDAWLSILQELSASLAEPFLTWKQASGDQYSLRYQLGTVEQHKSFNTEFASLLEDIIVSALQHQDHKTSALAFHLYETSVIYSTIPLEHSYLVIGAYSAVMDEKFGLKIVAKQAKKDKAYRSHRKWVAALSEYQRAHNL